MDDDVKGLRRWILGLLIGIVIIGFITVAASRAFDLAWFPWQVKMQTGMIRESNSYVTTQQTALRRFRSDYEDASTDGQRAAIVRQMREIADLIPDNVQPDVRTFLASH